VLENFLISHSTFVTHQFGFNVLTKNTPTLLVQMLLKRLLINRGSYVFSCPVNFQKTFDKVNYWKLYIKLLNDGADDKIVRILALW